MALLPTPASVFDDQTRYDYLREAFSTLRPNHRVDDHTPAKMGKARVCVPMRELGLGLQVEGFPERIWVVLLPEGDAKRAHPLSWGRKGNAAAGRDGLAAQRACTEALCLGLIRLHARASFPNGDEEPHAG